MWHTVIVSLSLEPNQYCLSKCPSVFGPNKGIHILGLARHTPYLYSTESFSGFPTEITKMATVFQSFQTSAPSDHACSLTFWLSKTSYRGKKVIFCSQQI
ncbi:hypothetical protein AAFF_G00331370 [Aldrovandia affinis]|uniref:Uncharacterized protein n=1 Tax=Aldrovandia affinis TaxID=143900 RepID=A0AAD7SLB8_9TELE|nr:hypothetical protein AAFF_G00331370 [Aldrovandia affinis]